MSKDRTHKTPTAKPKASSNSRRDFIKTGALAVGVSALAMPWVTTKARAAGTINVVLNQGLLANLWIEHLHPMFEKETGAKINLQQSVTSRMLVTLRVQKDNPPDLFQFSEAGVFLARDQGLLRQHNAKNIPNFKEIRPAFNLADYYSAGVVDALHTIFYNTGRVKAPLQAWAEMWEAKWKDQTMIPPVTWNSGVRMVTTAAQIATGKPLKEAQYEWEAGIKKLGDLKKNGGSAYTGAPQAIQSLQSGQIPIVPFYGIFINPLIDKGAPIAPCTYLKEGKQGEIVGMNMAAKAKNVELAEVYVNMSLAKGFQEKIDSVLRAPAANKEVLPSKRTKELNGSFDNIGYADWAYLSKNRSKITEKWNEVFG